MPCCQLRTTCPLLLLAQTLQGILDLDSSKLTDGHWFCSGTNLFLKYCTKLGTKLSWKVANNVWVFINLTKKTQNTTKSLGISLSYTECIFSLIMSNFVSYLAYEHTNSFMEPSSTKQYECKDSCWMKQQIALYRVCTHTWLPKCNL
jgi:hypothetical protein